MLSGGRACARRDPVDGLRSLWPAPGHWRQDGSRCPTYDLEDHVEIHQCGRRPDVLRGLVKVYKGAHGAKSNVVCDALLVDPKSRSDTYPTIEIDEDETDIGHEASVSKVGEEQLFYLMTRGLSSEQAASMVVGGFIEPLVKELPMEYAIELNRLIRLQMEGSVG